MNKITCALLILFLGCSKDNPVPLPTADFIINNGGKFAPSLIKFTNYAQNYTSLKWDFGDGNKSTDTNPSHLYTSGKIYNVTLEAINSENKSSIKTRMVTVLDTPTVLRIDKITIINLPFSKADGSAWDEGSIPQGPDPFFTFGKFITGYFEDITPSKLPLIWATSSNLQLTDFNSNLIFSVFDYDDTGNELIGSYSRKIISLIPTDGSDYPTIMEFGSKTSPLYFTMDITWLP